MNPLTLPVVHELRGNVCRCGKRKIERQTFCRACYFSLPRDVQRDLYKRVEEGYVAVYEKACGILRLPLPEVKA